MFEDARDTMRTRLTEITKTMRSMVTKAEAESRDLEDHEQRYYDQLDKEADGLQKDIESADRVAKMDNSRNHPNGELRILEPGEKVAREKSNLNLGKIFRGCVTGNWDGAEAERRATQLEGSDVLGGFLVPQPVAEEIIDLARSQSVVIRAGARTLALDSDRLTIAKMENDLTSYWTAEGATITSSDINFTSFNLQPFKLACRGYASLEVYEDAKNLDGILRDSMASSIALGIDEAFLVGDGGGKPKGITKETSATAVGLNSVTVGGNLGFDDLIDAWGELAADDEVPRALIMSPTRMTELYQRKDGEGQYMAFPPPVDELNKLVSSQMVDDKVIMGNFNMFYIGMRTSVKVEFSRTADDSFKKGLIAYRAYARVDGGMARPAAFCVLDSIT